MELGWDNMKIKSDKNLDNNGIQHQLVNFPHIARGNVVFAHQSNNGLNYRINEQLIISGVVDPPKFAYNSHAISQKPVSSDIVG